MLSMMVERQLVSLKQYLDFKTLSQRLIFQLLGHFNLYIKFIKVVFSSINCTFLEFKLMILREKGYLRWFRNIYREHIVFICVIYSMALKEGIR